MKKFILTVLLFTYAFTLTACNRQDNAEILKFQKELHSTLSEIESIHREINSADVTSPDASKEILDDLSELNDAFEALAQINVTDKNYSYITALASEGADYMTQAYDLFQKAYNGDAFDEDNAELAYKYLERASKRIRVIVTMLHGEIPEDVIIH